MSLSGCVFAEKLEEKDTMKKELNIEELENVAGGAGANRVESDGTVVAYAGAGLFNVNLDVGQAITATPSGQLRMNFIRVSIGDRVRVEYIPGDAYGRITYRYK